MKIHVVGIGGMGMSAVARLLMARGDTVSGADTGVRPVARARAFIAFTSAKTYGGSRFSR